MCRNPITVKPPDTMEGPQSSRTNRLQVCHLPGSPFSIPVPPIPSVIRLHLPLAPGKNWFMIKLLPWVFFQLKESKSPPKNFDHLPTQGEPSGAWGEAALPGPGGRTSGCSQPDLFHAWCYFPHRIKCLIFTKNLDNFLESYTPLMVTFQQQEGNRYW